MFSVMWHLNECQNNVWNREYRALISFCQCIMKSNAWEVLERHETLRHVRNGNARLILLIGISRIFLHFPTLRAAIFGAFSHENAVALNCVRKMSYPEISYVWIFLNRRRR